MNKKDLIPNFIFILMVLVFFPFYFFFDVCFRINMYNFKIKYIKSDPLKLKDLVIKYER